MRTSKDEMIEVKITEIPYIHPKLKLGDLQNNGKLYSDEQIDLIMKDQYIKSIQGRVTKKELNILFQDQIKKNPKMEFKFSLQKEGDNYSAIYKGKKNSLGSGAFGSVKLLQDLESGKTKHVLKVIKNTLPQQFIENEKRGLKIARQFKSLQKRKPMTAQYEFVMDLARGRTLDKFKNTKLPIVTWIDMIINVLKEVKHLHDNNMLHRDLKPANILFDPITKKAQVVDFGLATFNLTTVDILRRKLGIPSAENKDIIVTGIQDKIQGSPAYMSPEALVGQISEKSEIYALGISFAEILNLTERAAKFYTYENRYINFNNVKKVDEENINNTIADTTTRKAVLKMLQAMVNNNRNLTLTSHAKGGNTNIIEYFSKLREEYIDTLGLTHRIAYLNIPDYVSADANTKMQMLKALTKADEVWLIDNNEENKKIYLSLHAELASTNINVDYTVLQSDENLLDQAMRHYAHQCEIHDRNIYECSYVTKTGQLVALSANLNDNQFHTIISSLQNEANKFIKKQGNHPQVKIIHDTIAIMQKIHNENPITLSRAMKELDKLQAFLISEKESQINIKKLMHDLEVATKTNSPVITTSKGFDAAIKSKDPDFVGSVPTALEKPIIVNEDEASDRLTDWKNAIPLMKDIITDNLTLQYTAVCVPESLFDMYWINVKDLIPRHVNNVQELSALYDKLPAFYQEKLINIYSKSPLLIKDIESLNFILDKVPNNTWKTLLFDLTQSIKSKNEFKLSEPGFDNFLDKLHAANLFSSTLPLIRKLVKGNTPYLTILLNRTEEKKEIVNEDIKPNTPSLVTAEGVIDKIKQADQAIDILFSLEKRIEELPALYKSLGGKGDHEKHLMAMVASSKALNNRIPSVQLHQQITLLEAELMRAVNSKGSRMFHKRLSMKEIVSNLNTETLNAKSTKDLHHHYNRLLALTLAEIYQKNLPNWAGNRLTGKEATIRQELIDCKDIIKPDHYKYSPLDVKLDNNIENRNPNTNPNPRKT